LLDMSMLTTGFRGAKLLGTVPLRRLKLTLKLLHNVQHRRCTKLQFRTFAK
jgi:hypothetical protein